MVGLVEHLARVAGEQLQQLRDSGQYPAYKREGPRDHTPPHPGRGLVVGAVRTIPPHPLGRDRTIPRKKLELTPRSEEWLRLSIRTGYPGAR